MKYLKSTLLFLFLAINVFGQEFTDVSIDATITDVQPMTGIVFWRGDNTNTDAISLEYSYMLFDQVVQDSGVYNWSVVDNYLDDIASRGHQAIFRFRYTYVGYHTSVPAYIKALPDYHETQGMSEDEETWFPDWSHEELKRFTLEFYTKFAERYDDDPRLAFIQVGFGLWAEYHIYDGPFILGGTFPDKAFQETFFYHLDSVFTHTPWSISIDAADGDVAPFEEKPELLAIQFGNFDDSFMAEEHPYVNALNWEFFGAERYKTSPAGGEFSYYTDYDQEHVLDLPDGAHGISYEASAANFQISYMIGNDQPGYHSMARIKQASLATGYKFRINSFKVATDSAIVEVENVGIASFYYDAYPAVNDVRATESLRYLAPGETRTFHIAAGGENPVLTIACDRLVAGQHIDYFGTTSVGIDGRQNETINAKIFPSSLHSGESLHIEMEESGHTTVTIFNVSGQKVLQSRLGTKTGTIPLENFEKGIYFVRLSRGRLVKAEKIIVY